jgi:hypothetical protein
MENVLQAASDSKYFFHATVKVLGMDGVNIMTTATITQRQKQERPVLETSYS